MKSSVLLEKIGLTILLITIFVLPFLFLPFTSDFYEFNKNFLLFTSSGLLLIVLTLQFVVDRQVKFTRSPLGLPFLLTILVWIGSGLVSSPNRVEAFLMPGQAGTIVALGLLFFLGVNFVKTKKDLSALFYVTLSAVGLLGLVSLIWSSGLASKFLPVSLVALKSNLWSPTGSILTTLLIMVSSLPMQITAMLKTKSKVAIFMAVCLFLTLLGSGTIFYNFVNPATPTDKIPFMAHGTGWAIALDSLKSSPLLGTGPATYLSDFSRFRPVSFNQTPNWSLRFANSSSYWLQILTTTGILGLITWILVFLKSLQLVRKTAKLSANSATAYAHTFALAGGLSAVGMMLLLLFLPGGLVSVAFVFVYLILAVAGFRQLGTNLVYEANIDLVAGSGAHNSPILPWLLFVLSVLIVSPLTYLAARAYSAETYFQRALTAAGKNDGRTTYQNLISAMQNNPYMDNYRVAYSQTNLLLANSLAANQNLTDADRSSVTQLVQQAIQEGKNAVALNPLKVTNVENLANIYRNLLNFAQGADAWTVAAYSQAITLDPTNPNLRISLGGVYYALKNYDLAIQLFQQAANLKPDLANAQYNLAQSYLQKGDLQAAATGLQTTLTLLEPASADYQKVSAELADVKKKLGEKAPATTPAPANSALTKPEPIQPKVNPPLKLENAPPSAQP